MWVDACTTLGACVDGSTRHPTFAFSFQWPTLDVACYCSQPGFITSQWYIKDVWQGCDDVVWWFNLLAAGCTLGSYYFNQLFIVYSWEIGILHIDWYNRDRSVLWIVHKVRFRCWGLISDVRLLAVHLSVHCWYWSSLYCVCMIYNI